MKHTKPLMWAGIAATTLFTALFIASLFRQALYSRNNLGDSHAGPLKQSSITLLRGGLEARKSELTHFVGEFDPHGWLVFLPYGEPMSSWSTWVMLPRYTFAADAAGTFTFIQLPLWLPFLATALPTAFLIRAHLRATLRARAGNCPKCNYNLSGLAPHSPCPECGTTPPAREVTS